ncbi:hypothetical protein BDV19DRAFT_253319 [Aspergillus venezuelensis]
MIHNLFTALSASLLLATTAVMSKLKPQLTVAALARPTPKFHQPATAPGSSPEFHRPLAVLSMPALVPSPVPVPTPTDSLNLPSSLLQPWSACCVSCRLFYGTVSSICDLSPNLSVGLTPRTPRALSRTVGERSRLHQQFTPSCTIALSPVATNSLLSMSSYPSFEKLSH